MCKKKSKIIIAVVVIKLYGLYIYILQYFHSNQSFADSFIHLAIYVIIYIFLCNNNSVSILAPYIQLIILLKFAYTFNYFNQLVTHFLACTIFSSVVHISYTLDKLLIDCICVNVSALHSGVHVPLDTTLVEYRLSTTVYNSGTN